MFTFQMTLEELLLCHKWVPKPGNLGRRVWEASKWFRPPHLGPTGYVTLGGYMTYWVGKSFHPFELGESHRTTWFSYFAVVETLRADVELSSQLQSMSQ